MRPRLPLLHILLIFAQVALASCARSPTRSTDSVASPYERGDYLHSPELRESIVPLKPGTRFTVRQGAFGQSSHNEPGNEFSWDLEVPLGTSVISVDDGTVYYLYQPATAGGGCESKYANDAWNVLIEHRDGTVAQYTHVEGSVMRGQSVKRGDVIGQTIWKGWLCYEHVHLGIYRSREHLYTSPLRRTIPLSFKGIPEGILREGRTYEAPTW